MDANKKDWLDASMEENVVKNANFLLLNSEKSAFVRRYQISSIPRFMLIDKNGKIISSDAPRPSDPKLKNLMEKICENRYLPIIYSCLLFASVLFKQKIAVSPVLLR